MLDLHGVVEDGGVRSEEVLQAIVVVVEGSDAPVMVSME